MKYIMYGKNRNYQGGGYGTGIMSKIEILDTKMLKFKHPTRNPPPTCTVYEPGKR
jgi:hypothetical protein